MSIEKLTTHHINLILPIEIESYPDPWNYSHFLYEVYNPHSKSFVALSENNLVIGYLITHHIIDTIFVLNLAVDSKYRKMGIASRLLHYLVNFAENEKVIKIDLEVRKTNENALSLYRKEQFETIGERKNFYSDGEDAIIMCKNI
jgi:ribosomal-protein-alanine N-acetyltransferase